MQRLIDKTRQGVAKHHAHQLRACDWLLTHAIDMSDPWRGRPLDAEPGHEPILATIFARSIGTFGALVELARLGFGEPAAMLNRSLFEDMADAHWVTVEPDTAVELFEEHHLHGRMLLADAVRNQGDLLPDDDIPRFDPGERTRLDRRFGEYGEKPWTTLSMHARIRAIEHLWTSEEGQYELHFFRRIIHRENNQLLHVTALGLSSRVMQRTEDGLTTGIGPQVDEPIGRALMAGFWTFGQTASLVLDTFEFKDTDEWRERSAVRSAHSGRWTPRPCTRPSATSCVRAAAARSSSDATGPESVDQIPASAAGRPGWARAHGSCARNICVHETLGGYLRLTSTVSTSVRPFGSVTTGDEWLAGVASEVASISVPGLKLDASPERPRPSRSSPNRGRTAALRGRGM